MIRTFQVIALTLLFCSSLAAQNQKPQFNVIAFYTAKHDAAHISYVHEANHWFSSLADKHHFKYDSTNNWENLNGKFLEHYQVVIFLDTRPESDQQRKAFQYYMEHGGAWMGFHFVGFALSPSDYPQNWDWYHYQFLGSGSYAGNTWRPTSAVLRIENAKHPSTKNLPQTFRSAPNEWYRWTNDLRKNPIIKIIASIDYTSFPLGTGPKPHEIWHEGYYPVVWTNTKYHMIYFNMGHNDIDYGNKTNKQLSSSFSSEDQNTLITNALLWLGNENK
jgi:uncharacterized protein